MDTLITADVAFTDPGSLDTHTAVREWGDTTTSPGSISETGGNGTAEGGHSYSTPGVYQLKVTVTDKDGGMRQRSYPAVRVVNNVAPTGLLNDSGSEGAPITLGFSNQYDPSEEDTLAGFHYAFDCDGGSLAAATYADSGTSPTTTCAFTDGGSFIYPVRGKIMDKDGGATEYFRHFVVQNVAPTAVLSNDGPIMPGESVTVSFSDASDPSPEDTDAGFRYQFSCNGVSFQPTGRPTYANGTESNSSSCTFATSGTYTVKARILDKDNGWTLHTTDVIVAENLPPTVDAGGPYSGDEGSPVALSGPGASDQGGYKFMISADDDDPDTFRMKIWYEDDGEVVVYDNGSQQPLGGGSIVVHK